MAKWYRVEYIPKNYLYDNCHFESEELAKKEVEQWNALPAEKRNDRIAVYIGEVELD